MFISFALKEFTALLKRQDFDNIFTGTKRKLKDLVKQNHQFLIAELDHVLIQANQAVNLSSKKSLPVSEDKKPQVLKIVRHPENPSKDFDS